MSRRQRGRPWSPPPAHQAVPAVPLALGSSFGWWRAAGVDMAGGLRPRQPIGCDIPLAIAVPVTSDVTGGVTTKRSNSPHSRSVLGLGVAAPQTAAVPCGCPSPARLGDTLQEQGGPQPWGGLGAGFALDKGMRQSWGRGPPAPWLCHSPSLAAMGPGTGSAPHPLRPGRWGDPGCCCSISPAREEFNYQLRALPSACGRPGAPAPL